MTFNKGKIKINISVTRYILTFALLIFLSQSVHAVSPINCSQIGAPVKTIVLIPFDEGLVIPIPTPYTLEGQCYQADFNGDGQLDILEVTSDKRYSLFLAGEDGQFSSADQQWRDGYLGLDWAQANSTLYIDDYNADGRLDIMLVGNTNGDSSALLYSGLDGRFSDIALAWENQFVDPVLSAGIFTVGETAGAFEVSPDGSASYSLPIMLPPGIGGVQPQIALNYNSQAGNGLLGVGWNITGTSVIHRCPATIDQDGFVDGVDFDNNDRFCLDGQRLILSSGSYGANGSVYHTELESFSRITFYGAPSSGDSYFRVDTADGGTLLYGNTGDSQVEAQGRNDTMLWAIAKSTDADGNFIEYHYYENHMEGENFLSYIEYGHNALGTVAGVELLTADGRNDIQLRYASGSRILTSRLLTSVRTYVGNSSVGRQYVRDYILNYQDSSDTRRKRLHKITECAYSANSIAACKQSLTLNWRADNLNENNYPHFDNSVILETGNNTSWAYNDVGLLHVMDVDADGHQDIIVGPSSNGRLHHLKGSETGLAYQGLFAPLGTWDWGNDHPGKIHVMDINGDGKQDLVYGPSANSAWHWLESDGNQFIERAGIFHGYAGWSNELNEIHVGDYNGDGRDDIVLGPNTGGNWYYLESNGAGFTDHGQVLGAYSGWSGDGEIIRPMDINGDGRDDLVLGPDASGCFYLIESNVTPGTPEFTDKKNIGCDSLLASSLSESVVAEYVHLMDFNGDGLTDILYGPGANGWRLMLNTGERFEMKGAVFSGHNWSDRGKRARVMDIDGDGMQDILMGPTKDEGAWFWLRSNGVDQLEDQGVIYNDHGPWFDNYGRVFPIDVSGDGMQDLVFGPESNGNWYFNRALNQVPDLLAGVTTGYGNTVSIEYKPLTDSSVYTRSSSGGYPILDLETPMLVVASTAISNGIGGANTTLYQYQGLAVHLLGRGLLGFTHTIENNQAALTVTESDYDRMTAVNGQSNDFWKNGQLIYSKQTVNGVLLGETESEHDAMIPPQSSYGGLVVYTRNSTQRSFDPGTGNPLSESSTAVNGGMDGCGNFPETVVTTRDVVSLKTYSETKQTEFFSNTADCAFHLPKQLTVTTRVPDERQGAAGELVSSLTTEFTYWPGTRRIHEEKRQPGDTSSAEYQLTTSYYDGTYYYKNKVEISGKGITLPRVTETSLDYSHIFSYSATTVNSLGHSETRTLSRRHGQPVDLMGPNGIVNPDTGYNTFWVYDEFGRKLREIRVDGNQSNWSYNNCDASCLAGEKYIVTSQSDGAAPVNNYFDPLGREVRIQTMGAGGTPIYSQTQFDHLGRNIGKTNAYKETDAVYWNCTLYDAFGRVIRQSMPVTFTNGNDHCGSVSPPALMSYNYSGLTTTEFRMRHGLAQTAALQTIQQKNVLGKLVKVTDQTGNSTHYAYNALGKLIETIDPENNKISISYDNLGRKTAMSDPDMGNWSYEYNSAGELIRQTDAKGQRIVMAYDPLGRMVHRYKQGDVTGTETIWSYDSAAFGIGKLHFVQNTSDNYSRRYEYNAHGRVTAVNTNILFFGSEYTMRVDTEYDQFGRVLTRTYPDTDPGSEQRRFSVQNVYDNLGYLQEVRNAVDNTVFWTSNGRDASGRITSETLGDAITVEHSYDAAFGFKTGVFAMAGNTLQDSTFTYDSLGNLEQREYLTAGGNASTAVETFEYDMMNRLTKAGLSGPVTDNIEYAYSASGNILHKTDFSDQNNNAYQYGSTVRPHAVTSVTKNGNTHTYTYDFNGNVINRNLAGGLSTSTTYTWFNKPSMIELTGQTKNATFGYDDEHTRIWQNTDRGLVLYLNPRRDLGGNFEKRFEIDDQGQTRVVYKHAIYGASGVVAEYTVEEATGNASTQYLLKDHLGSIEVVVDENGNEKERFAFGPFGERRKTTSAYTQGPYTDAVLAQLTSSRTNHGYTGHEQLDSFGLVHMNGRIYDPMLGRFLSADPNIQFADSTQGYNRYAYVHNNPLSFTDPSGFFLKKIVSIVKKHWKQMVIAAVAFYTAGAIYNAYMATAINAAGGAMAITGSQFAAAKTAAMFASGAVSGAVSTSLTAASNGADFRQTIKAGTIGAVSGGAFGAINGVYGNKWSPEKMLSQSVTGGAIAQVSGGSFNDGFKAVGVASIRQGIYQSMEDVVDDLTVKAAKTGNKKVSYDPVSGQMYSDGVTTTVDENGLKMNEGSGTWWDALLKKFDIKIGMSSQFDPQSHSYKNQPVLPQFINGVSKIHDGMNMWNYHMNTGGYIDRGIHFNSLFELWSFAGMIPAAAATAYSLPGSATLSNSLYRSLKTY